MRLLLQEEETPISREMQGELFQVEQYVQMALQYLRMEKMNTDLVADQKCKSENAKEMDQERSGMIKCEFCRESYTNVRFPVFL